MSQTNVEKEVIQVENRRFKAMMDADADALESILADALTYTHTSAALETKECFIRRLASGTLKYESVALSNMQVRSSGTPPWSRGMPAKPSGCTRRYCQIWNEFSARIIPMCWQPAATLPPGRATQVVIAKPSGCPRRCCRISNGFSARTIPMSWQRLIILTLGKTRI